jgi:hypothetical protein
VNWENAARKAPEVVSEQPNQSEQPDQPDEASQQQIIRVTAVREDGAPPLTPDPAQEVLEKPVDPIEFTNPVPPPEVPAEVLGGSTRAPALSSELQAAKWYTLAFLFVMGVFSIAGLIGMIWITVRLIAWIEQ